VPDGRGEFDVREESKISLWSWETINVTIKGGKSVTCPVSMLQGAFLGYTTCWMIIVVVGFMVRDIESFMMAQYTHSWLMLLGESALPALDPPFELRTRRRPEKHKRKKSRPPIPLQLSTIQLSGTKRCRKYKQLGHNNLTCGQPRDENRRLKYKKKPW